MKLSTVLIRIPVWYRQEINPYLSSPPGMGKTATIEQAPALISAAYGGNYGFSLLNGGLLNEMDSMGYLIPRHHEQYVESVYTRPFWWTTREGKTLEQYDGGIIFIDEMDKAPVEVKKVWGEAMLSGRLGPHVLPKGWRVWAAGNRAIDRSGSTKELDHLINRRRQIEVTPDLDSLLDWQANNGCLPITMAFTKNNPEVVLQSKVPEKQGPWCTPRSLARWDLAVRLAYPEGNIPLDATDLEEMAGDIGEAASTQLINTIRLDKAMPKYENIVAGPEKVKVPERPDELMLVCFTLAHRVSKEDASAVIKYVERMPKEFGVLFARSACRRVCGLATTPAFSAWAFRNSGLMAEITKN